MASVNQKIENVLSDLVDGNIWPLSCPLETFPDSWIVYVPILEAPEEFGDDTDLIWVHHMRIHWFAKKQPSYISIRANIRSLLKEAGFSVEDFAASYESDNDVTHLVCDCSIMEE